jgi:hypothetical protein
MAWYDDVHFKQCAVTEFLVAEKRSVTKTDQWLKKCLVSTVDESTASC